MAFKFRAFYPQSSKTPHPCAPSQGILVHAAVSVPSLVYIAGTRFLWLRLPDPSGTGTQCFCTSITPNLCVWLPHIPGHACSQHTITSLSNHISFCVIDSHTKLTFFWFHLCNTVYPLHHMQLAERHKLWFRSTCLYKNYFIAQIAGPMSLHPPWKRCAFLIPLPDQF